MALKIEHVSKTVGLFSLRDVSLEVGESEYFVLLGPTAAGKTVLLETVMGFYSPDMGRVLLDGRDVTNVPTERRGIAYVPQDCALFPHLSVFGNVEFGLRMRRVASVERKRVVDGVVCALGLGEILGRMPLTLSGGERQKVALARVLVTNPKVVLLDEPLAAIDAEASRGFRDELKRLNRELRVSFLHVTHDQIEAFSLADKIALMREGRIVQVGDPGEVLSNPVDEFVALFLGYENVFHVGLVKHEKGISEVKASGVSFKLNGKFEGENATVAIHPEDIVIMVEAPVVSREWNFFEGKVEKYTNLGSVVEVVVDVGLVVKVFVDKRSFLGLRLFEGKRVFVGFRVDSVKVVSPR